MVSETERLSGFRMIYLNEFDPFKFDANMNFIKTKPDDLISSKE